MYQTFSFVQALNYLQQFDGKHGYCKFSKNQGCRQKNFQGGGATEKRPKNSKKD